MESTLLLYDLYLYKLTGLNFELNPYDKCVVKNMVEVKQCKPCWYVDEKKVSHMKDEVCEEMFSKMTERFGELSIKHGKKFIFSAWTLI